RTPAAVEIVLQRAHAGTGDVKMCPGRAVDEALQELRGGYRAAITPAGVLHVGELGIDQLVVGRIERQTPDALAGRDARFRQAVAKLVIVREQAGIFLAERNHDRARKRREIDHELRLETIL